MKALRAAVTVWNRLIDVIMVLAGILLWVQMLIVNVEVFARYFARPTTWVAEISSILILWIPFMVAAWVLRKDGHVRMDLVLQRFSPRHQAMINVITSLAGVVVMLIVTAAGLMTAIYWIGNKTPTMLMLPRSPIIGIIFVGSFMFAVQFFICAIDYLNDWRTEKVKAQQPVEPFDVDAGV